MFLRVSLVHCHFIIFHQVFPQFLRFFLCFFPHFFPYFREVLEVERPRAGSLLGDSSAPAGAEGSGQRFFWWEKWWENG